MWAIIAYILSSTRYMKYLYDAFKGVLGVPRSLPFAKSRSAKARPAKAPVGGSGCATRVRLFEVAFVYNHPGVDRTWEIL